MGMNLYLAYLATLISSFGFNTYNYIQNRKEEIKIKNRTLVFKKNLSHETKKAIVIGDTIPSIYFFGSSVLSLLPIVNLAVPDLSNRLYYGLNIDDAMKKYFDLVNDSEIIKRFNNGLSLKLMEECGYEMPESLKKVETKLSDIPLKEELKEKINEHIKNMYRVVYPNEDKNININDIMALSDKEFNKRIRKSMRLTYEENIDVEKINRISQL